MNQKTRDPVCLSLSLLPRNRSTPDFVCITRTLIPRNRSGVILVENIIFLILNILFISILLLFLFRQGSGAIVLEQSYAKNIALLIDSARPVTEMELNMKEGFVLAEKNGIERKDIVTVNENIITVKLSDKGGYEYSFFNNVDVTLYPYENSYIIKINGYKDQGS